MESKIADETVNQKTNAEVHHCKFCFDILFYQLCGGDVTKPSFPNVYCGLFVTWWKRCQVSAAYSLRGCIGTLQPRWLHTSIEEYSLRSAFNDQRFRPIWEGELPLLSCEVSLLFSFEIAKDWKDWEIGVHGISIKFQDDHTELKRTATFLPFVAEQNSWNRRETIQHLIRKAGFRESITEELLSKVELTRYQTTNASLTYEEYLEAKKKFEQGTSKPDVDDQRL